MGSLMQLLFDTMPLAGARYAVTDGYPTRFTRHTIEELQWYVVAAHPSDTEQFVVDLGPLSIEAQAQPIENLPVWSFDAAQSLTSVRNLDCRPSSEGFRKVRVLEKVSFGVESAAAGELEEAIEVNLGPRGKRMLRLDEAARVASFKTRGGASGHNSGCPWPVEARYEHGVLHAYLYEISADQGTPIPGGSIVDAELDVFLANVRKLESGAANAGSIASLLTDDCWQPNAPSASTATVPTSSTLGSGQGAASGGGTDGGGSISGTFDPEPVTTVRAVPERVLICTFICLTHVGDDYTPGRPAWGARLYPVIMVRSTHELGSVRAAVHLVRPKVTTIDGETGGDCSCSEMRPEMSTLLVSDSNEGDFPAMEPVRNPLSLLFPILPPIFPFPHDVGPVPFWNSMFAYYVPEAHERLGTTRIKMVDRTKGKVRTIPGALIRLGTDGRLHRRPRQGAFDNIHMAPPMRMPRVSGVCPGGWNPLQIPPSTWHALSEGDRTRWHFDDVAMAPICAHDCFHMHWRWGHAPFVSADDTTAHGFGLIDGTSVPYLLKGAPLIPNNQDLYVRICDSRSIVYEAEAVGIRQDEWAIVCHHGAGYVTDTGRAVEAGRAGMDALALAGALPTFTAETDSTNFLPIFGGGLPIVQQGLDLPTIHRPLSAVESWAVFYWRNRFYVPPTDGPPAPQERVTIIDMDLVLHERSAPGNK